MKIASQHQYACYIFLDATTTARPNPVLEDFSTVSVPGLLLLEPEIPVSPEFILNDRIPARSTTSLKPILDAVEFTLQSETTTTIDIPNLLHDYSEEEEEEEVSLHEHEIIEDELDQTTESGATSYEIVKHTAYCVPFCTIL